MQSRSHRFRQFISVAREKKQEAHRSRAYSSKSWRTHDRTGCAEADALRAYYPENVAQTQAVEGFIAQMRHFERPRIAAEKAARILRGEKRSWETKPQRASPVRAE